MANEINFSVSAILRNGYIQDAQSVGNVSITQAGKNINVQTVALTTSFAAIGKGAVGNIGTIFITNDTSNASTIEVSVDGGSTTLLKIPVGVTNVLSVTPAYTITNIMVKITAATGVALVRVWEA